MIFKHADFEFEELVAETVDGVRKYKTPNGDYPSVTTVLSYFKRKEIAEWRARVGETEANKISGQASKRGTAVHHLAEDYLSNKPDWAAKAMPANLATFNTIKPILDENINEIFGLEVPLWSDYLRVAGRSDCIGVYNGRKAIIDFKTSRKPKKEEWIQDYFIQGSVYAVMFEERTGIPINDVVIIIAVDDNEPQVFIEKRDNYVHEAIRKIRHYEKVHSRLE